jgi:small subunit ribosomal protein S21
MLIIEIKGDSIEKALKTLKRKVDQTKQLRELRNRKEFTKKSVERRTEVNKAKYIQSLKNLNEE